MQKVYVDRFNGYKQALIDNGLEFNPKMVIETGLSPEDGITVAEEILKMKELPDGIFAANDQCAIACMQVLKRSGLRIPEDIAFAGFNNDPLTCIIEPNLTTINYKGYEMGQISAKLLIKRLLFKYDKLESNDILMDHELIIRESSLRHK